MSKYSKCINCCFPLMFNNMFNYVKNNYKDIKICSKNNNLSKSTCIKNYNDYFNFNFKSIERRLEEINYDIKHHKINFENLSGYNNKYSLYTMILELHTQKYFQEYYKSLYQIHDNIKKEYIDIFNLSMNDQNYIKIDNVNTKFNDNPYDRYLFDNINDPARRMPLNRLISNCIKRTQGINHYVTLTRYSKFEPYHYNNKYYSCCPLSTSILSKNRWFDEMLRDEVPMIYKLNFTLDNEASNITSIFYNQSTSGLSEYEVILSPHVCFKKIDEHKYDLNKSTIIEYFYQLDSKYYKHIKCDFHKNNNKQNDDLDKNSYYDVLYVFKLFLLLFENNNLKVECNNCKDNNWRKRLKL